MANSVSRIKNTDSLAQWSEKINRLIDSVDVFVNTVGSFSSASPTINDLIVYDTTLPGWKNKTLIAGEVTVDNSFSSSTQIKLKLNPPAISSKTEITSVDSANDFLLIWDASDSGGTLKKVKPSNLLSIAGTNTQLIFNDGGVFAGDPGLTYNKTTDTLTIAGGLIVDTNTLFVNASTNRVGINTTVPAHTLDVTGDVNTTNSYRIAGTSVLSSNTLGATVVNSSLTSLGTLSSLVVSGNGSFGGTLTVNSLTSSGTITGNLTGNVTGNVSGNAGTASAVAWSGITSKPTTVSGFGITDAVTTSGNQTIAGTKTFSSTISGSINGTSLNITQYTINQNLGTTNTPTFGGLNVPGKIFTGPQLNRTIIVDWNPTSISGTAEVGVGYTINANGITITLPSIDLRDGDRISFIPGNNLINNYTIVSGNVSQTIINTDTSLIVDLVVPFDLIWNGSNSRWVLG